jgi:hypothetical protein
MGKSVIPRMLLLLLVIASLVTSAVDAGQSVDSASSGNPALEGELCSRAQQTAMTTARICCGSITTSIPTHTSTEGGSRFSNTPHAGPVGPT